MQDIIVSCISVLMSAAVRSSPFGGFVPSLSRPEKGLQKKSKPYAENNEIRLIPSIYHVSRVI